MRFPKTAAAPILRLRIFGIGLARMHVLMYNSPKESSIIVGRLMKNVVYLQVDTTDPAFNLALEEYVFEHMSRDREYLMMWRNANAIIVGRHQNTLAEINADFVRSKGIQVVRRLSGGGAVYHDLGNLNFTFIMDAQPGQQVDLRRFCEPVAEALCDMGAYAEVSGRNDILIDGQKISGNAQYVRQGRVMHHGTILFDSDLSVLGQALQVDQAKIQAKGVKSVRSRVTTVRPHLKQDLTVLQFRDKLVESLLKDLSFTRYELTPEDIAAVEELRKEKYATWEWNYGTSPACTVLRKRRIEGCGTVEAHILLDGSRIQRLKLLGDFFSTMEPEPLENRLTGCRLDAEDCAAALAGCHVSDYISGLSNAGLIEILCDL